MIKKNILFLLFLTLANTSEYPFKIGETLNYSAFFSNIKAAKGSLKVINTEKINNIETYHVQFKAKTSGFINRIFPINDVIDLWLNKKDLIPVRVRSNIKEGRFVKKEDILFFQDQQYVIIDNKKIQFKEEIHSPYSLFYFFRNQKLENFNGSKINTIQNKKTDHLTLNIETNIIVKVPAGSYTCTKVEPLKMNNENFKNNATMEIYFSEDKNKYPVKIKIQLKYGSLVLKLEEIIS